MTSWWDEDLELSISSYLNFSERDAGMEACERLLSRVGLPPDVEQATRRNQTWYLDPLCVPEAAFREPGAYFVPVPFTFPVIPGWSRFNPSIALGSKGEWRCIVRSSNYTIDGDGRYVIPPEDNGVIRTQNYLVDIESDLVAANPLPINTEQVDGDRVPYLVQGFEDCRLFWHDRAFHFSATVRDRHPDGTCQIAVCRLQKNHVATMRLASGRRRHEKNWMPIPFSWEWGSPQFLYSCAPTIRRSARAHGPNYYWTGRDGPWVARSFSGGSQVVHVPHLGYLAVVHEAITFDQKPVNATNRRIYQHRFVRFNVDFRVIQVSRPFCFHGKGIEFAAGLIVEDNDVIVSYGVNDAQAYLVRLPLEHVRAMLRDPLPEDA